jgi:uncharacterized protein CbrC (UPF0167 family)
MAAALALCVLAFAAGAGAQAVASKFKVATTFTVIADMAQNVAGDTAEVVSITRPGPKSWLNELYLWPIANAQCTPHLVPAPGAQYHRHAAAVDPDGHAGGGRRPAGQLPVE